MMQVKTPDDAIRLAKQLAFMLSALGKELGLDLTDTQVEIGSDDKTLLTINAGELCDAAKALQYGSLGDGDD